MRPWNIVRTMPSQAARCLADDPVQSHVRSYVMRKAVSQLSRRGYSSHSIPMLAAQDAANPLDPESARKEWKCLDVGPMDCPRAKCRPQRCTKCKVNRPLCFFLREKYLLGELDIFCHTYHKVRDAWKGNQGDFQRLHLLTRQAGIRQVRNDVEMHVSEWECRINTYHDKQFSNKAWSHGECTCRMQYNAAMHRDSLYAWANSNAVLERLQIGSAILVDSWLNDSSNAMSSDDQCASHDSMSMDTDTAQTSPDSSVNPVSTSSPQSSKKQPSPSMMLVIEETPPHSPRQRESIPEHMKDLDYMYDLYSGSYRASTGTGSSPSMSRSISRDPSPLVLDTGSSNVISSQEDAGSGSDDSQAGVGMSVASDYAESSTCGEEADLVLQSSTDSEDNIDSERLSSITPDESSNTTPDDAARQESDFIETIDLEVAGFEGACTDQRNGLHKYDEFCTSIEVGIHRLEEELAKKRHKHHALRARRVSGIASFEAKKLKKQMNLEKRINDITYGQLQVLSEVQKVRADAHITQMIQKKKDLRDQWLKRLREAAM